MKKIFQKVIAVMIAVSTLSFGVMPVTHAETIVYTTRTGSKYHSRKSCPTLSRSRVIYSKTLSEAKAEGLDACKVCARNLSSTKKSSTKSTKKANYRVTYQAAPAPDKNAYRTVNGNKPTFTKAQMTTKSFERYSALDSLGRCRTAFVNASPSTLPTKKRGSIGMVKPTGWHTVRYSIVGNGSAGYLYNRCHLIAYCLTAENANKKNLITGTRYMNNEGMLPYEEKTARYIDKTNNHVLYRVTPVFEGSNLVASGVLMEAYSVEDQGKGICFCTYCYNVQPGVAIDYATGDSHLSGKNNQNSHNSSAKEHASAVYILNTNTKKFHKPDCYSVKQMSSKNRKKYKGLRKKLIKDGYSPCKNCNP